jgi:hypothetical protein
VLSHSKRSLLPEDAEVSDQVRRRPSVLHLLEHHPMVLKDLALEDLEVRRDLVAAHPFTEVGVEQLRKQGGVQPVFLQVELVERSRPTLRVATGYAQHRRLFVA